MIMIRTTKPLKPFYMGIRWKEVVESNIAKGGEVLQVVSSGGSYSEEHEIVTRNADGSVSTDHLFYQDGVLQSWTVSYANGQEEMLFDREEQLARLEADE